MKRPLVGMLTTRDAATGFGEQAPLFRALLRSAGQEQCRAYVFTPGDIDWETGIVRAWIAGRGGWRRARSPLPDVVYDRIVNRRDAASPAVAEAVRRLKDRYPGRYFNPGFLDKWEVYQALLPEPGMGGHLPLTRLFTGPETVREVAAAGPLVFLKPRAGTQGRQIVRMERLTADPAGPYRVRGRDGRARVTTLEAAVAGSRVDDGFLVQQGIILPGYRRRPFDFRALLHRDGGDGWRLTALVARVGRAGGITSNLHTGGAAVRAQTFLRRLYRGRSGRAAQVQAGLQSLALRLPPLIEKALGSFGELGLDLLLDSQGHPWFLEANARPGRRVLVLARVWGARRLAGRRIFRYARSLAKGDGR